MNGMKKKRLLRASARPLAVLCVLGPLFFLSACSVSQHPLPRVSVLAELRPDGALRITEEVTYELGAGVRSISHALEASHAAGIADVSACARMADGRRVDFALRDHAELGDMATLVARPAGETHLLLTLYHPFSPPNAASTMAAVTVTYSYSLRGLAQRYSDAGTFTWEPLGSRGWDVPIAQWSARIALPLGAEDRLDAALLHAPSRATLTRRSDGVSLSTQPVSAGTRVGIRVDFAPELLVHMPIEPGQPLAALRAEARNKELSNALLGYGWAALCGLASLGLAAWFHHRKGIKKEARGGPALGVTAPAELSTLVPLAGGVGPRDVAAMLLHLVHRNHLALLPPDSGLPLTRETLEQARLIRLPAPRDRLLDGEFFLIHWFVDTLGDGKAVTMEQIRRVPRASFDADYRVWRQLVNEQIAQRPWFEALGSQRKTLVTLGVGLLLGTPVIAALGALPIAWLGVPIGLATVAYARRMRRRTASAALEVKRWRSLRVQLLAGRVQGATTLAQWERILLYAHAMGIGPKAAAAMQAAVAAEAQGKAPAWPDARDATFMAWPLLDYPGHLARWFELLCRAIMPVR